MPISELSPVKVGKYRLQINPTDLKLERQFTKFRSIEATKKVRCSVLGRYDHEHLISVSITPLHPDKFNNYDPQHNPQIKVKKVFYPSYVHKDGKRLAECEKFLQKEFMDSGELEKRAIDEVRRDMGIDLIAHNPRMHKKYI